MSKTPPFAVGGHVTMRSGRTGVITEIYVRSERPFAWVRLDVAPRERHAVYLDELAHGINQPDGESNQKEQSK